MEEGGGLMHSGPPEFAEAVLSLLVPPACREEVVGDLHERYKSPRQYAIDVLHTVPLVIASRMRRTTDPQVLLIQAFVLYSSFLCAAWFKDGTLLREPWGLWRLALPAVMWVVGLILDDTYAGPGRRSSLKLAQAPLLGLVFALVSQEMLRIGNPGAAIPRSLLVYGCGIGLLLSSAVRFLFPPMAVQFLGIRPSARQLKRAGESRGKSAAFVMLLLLLWLTYQICKRA
jgi:hypothetical protein